jgi:hypothetical protein
MATVYLLWHEYETDDGRDEEKFIGVYSTEEMAQRAIEQLRNQPGFKDIPEGFKIYPNIVDETGWPEGFVTVMPGEE